MQREEYRSCVIVGGGAAGFQAASVLRKRWPDNAVIIIDAEAEVGYYRSLLPQFMAGALPEERLFFPSRGPDPLLVVRSGVRVHSLDRCNSAVTLENGEVIPYERLILAHGGTALLPGLLADIKAEGIFPVRTLTEARKARRWLAAHRKVTVFGASLVAVKTAVYLRQAGFEVTILARREHILLRVLTPRAAEVVEAHLRQMGINLLLGSEPEDFRAARGALEGISLGGQWRACDTLLVAAGAMPDVGYLRESGLLEGEELTVSAALQTRDERIFAAGDGVTITLADGVRVSPRTWPEAVGQGKLAAENLYRPAPLAKTWVSRVNAMDLHGLPLVILGPPIPGAAVDVFTDARRGVRREIFLLGGRIVGGALIGDISGAGTLYALMASDREIAFDQPAAPGRQAIRRWCAAAQQFANG